VSKNSCVGVEATEHVEPPVAMRINQQGPRNVGGGAGAATAGASAIRRHQNDPRYGTPMVTPPTGRTARHGETPDISAFVNFNGLVGRTPLFGRTPPSDSVNSATRLAQMLDEDELGRDALSALCSRLALFGFDLSCTGVVCKCISEQLDASHRYLQEARGVTEGNEKVLRTGA
jgi:hypothetical protein